MSEVLQQNDEKTALPEIIKFGDDEYTVLFPDLIRPLSQREYQALKNSIRKHGIKAPVVIDKDGGILDGANRARIAAELKSQTLSTRVVDIAEWEKKRELALSLNIDRRSLSQAERQALVDARRQRVRKSRDQGKSLRTIAEEEGSVTFRSRKTWKPI
jgi:ParB-like chromosome segregation protein Spo0J